jgi:hypothetical protein
VTRLGRHVRPTSVAAAEKPAFDATLKMSTPDGGGQESGTCASPGCPWRLLVHAWRHRRAAGRVNGWKVAAARVMLDGGCTLIAPTWAVTAAHPDASGPADPPTEVDLALLEFTTAVKGIEPVAPYKGRRELGLPAFIVGYGDHGVAGAPFQRTMAGVVPWPTRSTMPDRSASS